MSVSWFIEIIRSGRWLTEQRARCAAAVAIGATLVVIVVIAARGIGEPGSDRPLGTDFESFYAAGNAALAGAATTAYDPRAHYTREQALFGTATPFYAWQYPPPFLLLM